MTSSLFDHPHFKPLLSRDDLAALFSAGVEVAAMLRFEAALAEAEAEAGVIPEAAASAIVETTKNFEPDDAVLAAGVGRDGLVLPVLVNEFRKELDEAHRPYLHFGATSQDVIDTGLMLRLKEAFELLRADIEGVAGQLEKLAAAAGSRPLMGRTRMQRALPVRLADRIGIWKAPLLQHLAALEELRGYALTVQFGGPVGTLEKLGDKGPLVRKNLAEKLALVDPGCCWHTDRSRIADIANWLAKLSGTLGKIGQDVVLMAQNEVGEVELLGGGLSSAMPHKKNPVRAEMLVSLARYNAVQLGGIHQAVIHENERSGSAWTLEWLTLPMMVATTGAALGVAGGLLDDMTFPAGSSEREE